MSPEQQQLAALFDSALEVSCTPAHQKEDLELGKLEKRSAMMLQPPAVSAAPSKLEVGTYLGHLLRLRRAGIPPVACALLSQQEAAVREAWLSRTLGFWRSLRTQCAHLHPRTHVLEARVRHRLSHRTPHMCHM